MKSGQDDGKEGRKEGRREGRREGERVQYTLRYLPTVPRYLTVLDFTRHYIHTPSQNLQHDHTVTQASLQHVLSSLPPALVYLSGSFIA